VTAKQSGMSDYEVIDQIKLFNSQFTYPLPEHRLLMDCKPSDYIGSDNKKHFGWERKFKDSTIRKELGIPDNKELDLFRGEGMSKSESNKLYYNKKRAEKVSIGNTKTAEIERLSKVVIEMRTNGRKWQEIADHLGINERTARRYEQRAKSA